MKKILLTLFTLTTLIYGATAQNVNIPDANFKNYLVLNTAINTNMDSEIQMSEAHAYTGTITVQNKNISDLTGIEAFDALTKLNCRFNNLTSLNVTQNTALTELRAGANDITSLDVSQNTALTVLDLQGNLVSSIDLSQNTALVELHCNYNNFSTIDLSNNTALTFLACNNNPYSTIDLSQNTALETLFCGDTPNLTTLDLSNNTALISVNCNFVSLGNLSTINFGQNTNLENISCDYSGITTLDVSQNTGLKSLFCQYANLTSLDVSQNLALENLRCSYNNITNINFGQITSLKWLECIDNNLTELDLSQNPQLNGVIANNNSLASLNMKNGSASLISTNLFRAHNNPNLTCIEVDDVAAATAEWTNIDAQTSFSTSCSPIVNIPDANFKAYLVGNNLINTNMDAEIQVSEATAFSGAIECYGDNISDLTGIEAFTALTELDCDENNLTTLDVSQNTALTKLSCSENNLSSLDVSQNTALEILWCTDSYLTALDVSQNTNLTSLAIDENNLTALDVSLNTSLVDLSCGSSNLTNLDVSQNLALLDLWCRDNNLTTLDLSNNSNLEALDCRDNNLTELNLKNISASVLSPFKAQNNPNLTCIEVDDVAAATAAWTDIDPQTSFSESCGVVPVTSISVQGQAGATTISTLGGTLQMEAEIFPMNATDNTYTWSVINLSGSADIDANGLLTAMTDGTVKVGVTANDGSGVTGSADIIISNQSSSIGELNTIPNISIYPNPANAQIIIDAKANIEAIRILDIMGKTVKTIIAPNATVDVSDLAKGIYFLEMQVDDTLVSKKIIKE